MPPEATIIEANRPPDGLLLSTIALPLLLSGADNLVLYANEAAEAFFGRSSRRIIGEPAQSLLRFASDRLNGAIAARESDISAQNMRFQTHGAQANYVDLNIATPLGYPDCRLYILVPRQADRDQIGEQTDGGKQQAMAAPAILGHEIKNPLAGIKGAAQLLARKVDPQQAALTDLIVHEVDRIARLLDQMQNLGRVMPGQMEAENIHELIERAIRSVRAANRTMPAIDINYDPSLPDVQIEADAMVQVLINLIQNAIDALAQTDDPQIGISTRFVMGAALRSEGDKGVRLPVEVAISDNGPGIAQHIENELFSPFVTTKREGQGLGLAIVRKYLSQMNGRIAVERDGAGQRTIFRIFLPVAERKTSI
ncbi:MAG: PAS domain-containing sensor histidine kinase [Sphingomonadaceae bacterium]|nr:PAS domain-containing sensor histidine kinase [Sphingomonadaceae bacterium]